MILYKEITPLTKHDVFIIVNSENVGFEYPIHYHSAFELTLILNSSGNRIVGDSVEKYKSNRRQSPLGIASVFRRASPGRGKGKFF